MVGDKQLAELSSRRCCRCGRLIYLGNVDALADALDQIVDRRTQGFCIEANGMSVALQSPKVCLMCIATHQRHLASAARKKTK